MKHFPKLEGAFYFHPSNIKSTNRLYPDTRPVMEVLKIDLWRSTSPTQKMQILAQLIQSTRLIAIVELRSQYPQPSETEFRRRLTGLLIGEDIACKFYEELPHAK